MHKLYVEEYSAAELKPLTERMCRDIFNTEFKIGFFKSKKDQCTKCNVYESLTTEQKSGEAKQEYDNHIKRKEQARDHKMKDKIKAGNDKSFHTVSFELQQVLQSPVTNDSILYYKRKLAVYNFTIYDHSSKDGACYVWHEGEAKRGSAEMASCLFHYMEHLHESVKHISLYSDTCGGQNRNKQIAAMCLLVVKTLPIDVIDHKFMESGHSEMECDSMHSTIEKAAKNVKIQVPRDWHNVILMARQRQPYNVVEMQQQAGAVVYKL